MTTQDYREKSPLMIFLSYFKNHRWLFAADVTCAVGIAAIDLLFPLVTRSALYEMLTRRLLVPKSKQAKRLLVLVVIQVRPQIRRQQHLII